MEWVFQAYQYKIFDIFSKLQNDDNSSGIGSIVKRIIEFYKEGFGLKAKKKWELLFFFTIPKDHGTA
jgi:hypothetical protein